MRNNTTNREVKMDLVNKQFGCWTVLDEYKRVRVSHGTKILWKCRCRCGTEKYIYRSVLLNGKNEYCDKCRPKGVRNEALYHIYHGIKQRCFNPNNPKYGIYGGRGITICKEWNESYDAFKEWSLLNGYEKNLTIDRIDSNKDYSPDNCRWVTLSVNSAGGNIGKHKSKTKLHNSYGISPDGERFDIDNVSQFCKQHNLNRSNVSASLHGRISSHYNGWVFHSEKSRH